MAAVSRTLREQKTPFPIFPSRLHAQAGRVAHRCIFSSNAARRFPYCRPSAALAATKSTGAGAMKIAHPLPEATYCGAGD